MTDGVYAIGASGTVALPTLPSSIPRFCGAPIRETFANPFIEIMKDSNLLEEKMKTATMKKARYLSAIIALITVFTLLGVFPLMVSAGESTTLSNITVDIGTEYVTLSDGDKDGFYDIKDADDLYAFAAAVNGGKNDINGELTANITVNSSVLDANGDLNGTGAGFRVWTAIGNDEDVAYKGTFNGNGKTISGLYFNYSSGRYVGLFGYAVKNADETNEIKNVGLVDSYFYGGAFIGGIVGHNETTVSNCYSESTITGTYEGVGGIVGYNEEGAVVTDCYNTGIISGDNRIGGIVGENNGQVTRSYNTGAVSGNNSIGAIVGANEGNVSVCYNQGNVSGNNYVGGIVGDNLGELSSSYTVGGVDGFDAQYGSVVGNNYKGTITNCYYLGEIGGVSNPGGINNADVIGSAEKITEDDLDSGKATYLLNGSTSDGALNWYQTIGVDAIPQFDDESLIVYHYDRESGSAHEYANHAHDWTVEVVDNEIRIVCINDTDCHWHNGNGGILELTATTKTYDSTAAEVKYEYSTEWYFDEIPLSIVYYDGATVLADAPVNVGNYCVEITYGIYTAHADYAIEQAEITDSDVTLSAVEATYDRNPHTFDVTVEVGTLTLVEGRDYILTFTRDGVATTDFTSAGVITAVVEGIGNYKGVGEADFEIKHPEITPTDVVISDDVIYDAKAHVPTVTVTVGTLTLIKGVDYKVTYLRDGVATTDFTNVGVISVVVEGINNFVDTVSYDFEIKKATITDSNVTVSDDVIYNATAQIPDVEVVVGTETLVEGIDYTVTFKRDDAVTTDFTNVGTITVIVEGKGNYTGTGKQEYKIECDEILYTDVYVTDYVTYKHATEQKPVVSVTIGPRVLVKGVDYEVTYLRNGVETTDFTNSGAITVVIKGIGNYASENDVRATYTINRAPITLENISISDDVIYDATEHLPNVIVKVGSHVLDEGTEYVVSYSRGAYATSDFTSEGTITVSVYGVGNYTGGTYTKSYTIERAEIDWTDVVVSDDVIYDTLEHVPTVSVTVGGRTLVLNTDYTVTFVRDSAVTTDFTNAGTILVIVNGIGNYTGIVREEYIIDRAEINYSDVTVSGDVVYDSADKTPTIDITVGTHTLVEGVDYIVTYLRDDSVTADLTNEGKIAVIVEGINNYWNTVTNYFTIERASIEDSDVVVSDNVIYDALAHVPTVSVTVGGRTLVLDTDYTVTFTRGAYVTTDFTNAGTVIVTVEGKGNYTGTVTKNYVIGRAEIESTDVFISDDVIYNANAQKPTTWVIVGTETLVEGIDYEITYLRDGVVTTDFTNAGEIVVLIEGIGNYYTDDTVDVTKEYVIERDTIYSYDVYVTDRVYYNTFEQTPYISVVVDYLRLYAGTDYTVTYERDGVVTTDLTSAGSITVTIEGIGNYQGTVKKTYVIDKDILELELISPVVEICPGNKFVLVVHTNSSELPAPSFNNVMFVGEVITDITGAKQNTVFKISVNEDYVFGLNDDTITIVVTYAETDNYLGGSQYITIKVHNCNCDAEIEALRTDLAYKYSELANAIYSNDVDIAKINYTLASIKTTLATLATKTDVANEIKTLSDLINSLTARVTKNEADIRANTADIDNLTTTVTNLATELRDADEALANGIITLNSALSDLADRVAAAEDAIEELEKELAAAIDKFNKDMAAGDKLNADAISKAIEDLTALIDKAKLEASNANAALKVDLEQAIEDAKTAVTTAYENAIADAVAKLNAADKTNADAINKAVEDLTALIDAAKKNAADDNADLEEKLEQAIKDAKTAVTTAYENAIADAVAKLNAADKTNADAINKAVEDLTALIDAAKKNAADDNAALEEKLEQAIEDAKTAVTTAYENAIADAVAKLETADKNNAAAMDKAIQDLETLIDAAENAAIAGDNALSSKITAATKTLENAIKALEDTLNDAKDDLDKAIADLDAAMTKGDTDLSNEIANVNAALENAKIALEKADADNKAELIEKIEKADVALENAIADVQKNLDDAKAELDQAIADLDAAMTKGDADLSNEIANVNAALENAKTSLEKADADNKAELVGKIEVAEAALDAAIEAVQKNLDDAKAELNQAIINGNAALDEKISALNVALDTAKTALEASNSASSAELATKIDEADKALKLAIDALSSELNDVKQKSEVLEEKNNNLQTFLIVVSVISGTTLCGSAAFIIWFFSDRKRRLL